MVTRFPSSHTSGDTVTSDADAEAIWPSDVALSVDEIDDDKTDTFAPFLRDVPPNGPDDFLSKIHFEGDIVNCGRLLLLHVIYRSLTPTH